MSGISHRFVQVNGINMHIAEAGTGINQSLRIAPQCGGPLVLLLHGFPDFWYSWRYQIPALARAGFHVVAPDIRGFGETEAPTDVERYTIFHITGDLLHLIDILGEKKVFVVGHDWGAEAACALALFRPDRIKGLVTLSVPYTPRQYKGSLLSRMQLKLGKGFYMLHFQNPGYAEAEILRIGLGSFLREIFLLSQTSPLMIKGEKLGDAFKGSTPFREWFTEEDLSQYVQAFERSGLSGPLSVYRAIERTWELQAPFTNAIIATPAMFIAGSKDIVWHVPGTREYVEGGGLKRFLPNLKSYVILESGHFIQQEQHEKVNTFLVDFLRTAEKGQAKL